MIRFASSAPEFTGLDQPRWYDPNVQRWLEQDPIFPESGSNPYEYCGNDPANAVDPTGLATVAGVAASSQLGPGTWLIVATDGDPNMTGGGSGHSWLALVNKDSSGTQVDAWGFYPKGAGDSSCCANGGPTDNSAVPGELRNENNRVFKDAIFVSVSLQRYGTIMGTINVARAHPTNWQILSNNCTTWVVKTAGMASFAKHDSRAIFGNDGTMYSPSALDATMNGLPDGSSWLKYDPNAK